MTDSDWRHEAIETLRQAQLKIRELMWVKIWASVLAGLSIGHSIGEIMRAFQ